MSALLCWLRLHAWKYGTPKLRQHGAFLVDDVTGTRYGPYGTPVMRWTQDRSCARCGRTERVQVKGAKDVA